MSWDESLGNYKYCTVLVVDVLLVDRSCDVPVEVIVGRKSQ